MVTSDTPHGIAVVDVRGRVGTRHDAELSCFLCGELGIFFRFYDLSELGYSLFAEHYFRCPAKPSKPISLRVTWPDGRPPESYEFDPRSRRAAGVLSP